MYQLVVTALSWLVRGVVGKAIVGFVILAIFFFLVPLVWSLASPYLGSAGVASINGLFAAIPDSIYWGFYALRLDVGIPAMVGAWTARFLIRRIPFMG